MQLGHGESIRQTSMSSTITSLETLLLLVSRPPKAAFCAPDASTHSESTFTKVDIRTMIWISRTMMQSSRCRVVNYAWNNLSTNGGVFPQFPTEAFPWWRCYTMNPWRDTPKGSFQGHSYYSLDFFLETHSWKENDQNFLNKNASGSPRCKHLERQVFVTSFPCVCRYVFILRLPTPTRRSEAVYGGLLLACCHSVQ